MAEPGDAPRAADRPRPRSVRDLVRETEEKRAAHEHRAAEVPLPARDALEDRIAGASEEAPAPVRRFRAADDVEWLARASGECLYGTGPVGTAPLIAVEFSRPETPDSPARVALVPRGRFEHLFDAELVTLLKRARPVRRDDERA